jgi:hypothetical protein
LASRLLTIGVGVGAGVFAGGCSNSGSYTLKWQFNEKVASDPTDSFKPGDCGRVGVSGIGIAATRSDGKQSSIAVPCGLGFYDGSLDAGSWTLALVALDASGQPKVPIANEPPNEPPLLRGQTADNSPVEIHAGEQAAPIPSVFLPPLQQCQDGVDNDLDGRVDLDDPDCVNPDGTPNPTGPAECVPADGVSCPDTSL